MSSLLVHPTRRVAKSACDSSLSSTMPDQGLTNAYLATLASAVIPSALHCSFRCLLLCVRVR